MELVRTYLQQESTDQLKTVGTLHGVAGELQTAVSKGIRNTGTEDIGCVYM